MKSLPLSLLITILAGLSACSNQSGNKPIRQTSPIQFSETYEPPVFTEKERMQKMVEVLSESHHYYEAAAEANHLPGLAYGVVVDDSLIFFGGCGTTNLDSGLPVTEHSLFRIASMSKSFTAMAILKLRDEGKLSLSDPAFSYIPELEQLTYLTGDATPVSIFNLLTMTAGFPEDTYYNECSN